LHAAIFAGDLSWLRKHLDAGANINDSCRGEPPLCLALKRRSSKTVRYVLKQAPNVKKTNHCGQTPLHFAAMFNADARVIEDLVRLGADVNARDRDGDTPVNEAAAAGNLAAARCLIEHGAELRRGSRRLGSAIDRAIEGCYFETARLLIDEGARASLHQAVECGHIAATKKLIQEGVDLNSPGSWRETSPLSLAVIYGYPEIMELLLEAGADPNIQSQLDHGCSSVYGGDTPLHEAVERGSARMVKVLLSCGADPDIQNGQMLSPLEIAKRGEKTYLVHLMEDYLDRNKPQKAVDQLYTISKVAEMLSVEEAFVVKLISAGKLRQLKLDAQTVRVTASSLGGYFASLRKY